MINVKRPAPVSTSTLPLLMDALADPCYTASSVADAVSHDPGLASRILGLANSAQFGLSRRVSELETAIGLVGTSMVQTLAIANGAALLDRTGAMADARRHAFEVAAAARLLAPIAGVRASDAFAAGLLHDLGELLLMQMRPTDYAGLYGSFLAHDHQLVVERDVFGTDHALLAGEHLLEWRVPEVIADAVADHHDPFPGSHGVTIVVAAADELVTDDPDRRHALTMLALTADEIDGYRGSFVEEADQLEAVLA